MNGTLKGRFTWNSDGTGEDAGGGRRIWAGKFVGLFTSDPRGGFMDGTKWVCVGTTENKDDIPQASNGYLTVTDSDGDQAYATWTGRKELKPGEISGAGLWTRGTGKWAAISGGMTYSGKAILGTTQGYVDVEGNEGMSAGAESAS